MKAISNLKRISQKWWNAQQSWNYQSLIAYKKPGRGHEPITIRLKVSIDINAYDFQSYAKVLRWDGSEWQLVAHTPGNLLNSEGLSYTNKGAKIDLVLPMEEDILKEALQIVGDVVDEREIRWDK